MRKNKAVTKFLTKVGKLQTRLTTMSVEFNDMVIESVKLVWEHGDISPVNKMIAVSSFSKGLDRRALVTFYRECVPFAFIQKEQCFTVKDKKKFAKMKDAYMQFLLDHNWYDYSKVSNAVPYNLNVDALIKMVTSRIKKSIEQGTLSGQSGLEKLAKLKEGVNEGIIIEINTLSKMKKVKPKLANVISIEEALFPVGVTEDKVAVA